MGWLWCDNPIRDCGGTAEENRRSCSYYKECMVWYVNKDGAMRLVKKGEYKKGGRYENYFKEAKNEGRQNGKVL